MILSGSATAAGISHASLTLKTVGMADLLDGVKSDANRTFDYLNGALAPRYPAGRVTAFRPRDERDERAMCLSRRFIVQAPFQEAVLLLRQC